MSTRETILAAIATALTGASVASGNVFRSRQEAINLLPSVVVEPVAEQADETVLGMLDRTLTVAVGVYVEGDPADNAADATVALVESTLLADRTLGLGSEVQIRSAVDTRWEFDEQDLARVTVTFSVSYRTAL
ncbi:MAG: hypothetical protein MUF16_04970 [Burkholderiaceae bacterium]|jgi:hypothetical protein|nr:hypothetical protein [Burkholderiaceae bacterium]